MSLVHTAKPNQIIIEKVISRATPGELGVRSADKRNRDLSVQLIFASRFEQTKITKKWNEKIGRPGELRMHSAYKRSSGLPDQFE